MQTAFWASTLLLVSCLAHGQSGHKQNMKLSNGRTLVCVAQSKVTNCSVLVRSKSLGRVTLPRDETVASNSPLTLKLIATTANAAVIVDSYSSKPAGLNQCQAGAESFLRVLSLAGGHLSETFHTKLESCRSNVELALDGLAWDAAKADVHVHWLSAPGSGQELEKDFPLDGVGESKHD